MFTLGAQYLLAHIKMQNDVNQTLSPISMSEWAGGQLYWVVLALVRKTYFELLRIKIFIFLLWKYNEFLFLTNSKITNSKMKITLQNVLAMAVAILNLYHKDCVLMYDTDQNVQKDAWWCSPNVP